MSAAAPAAPALEGSTRRWRRLAWWSLFVAGNAALAAAIALGNVPLRDNPGGSAGLAYLAIALPGHLLAFGALAGLLPLLLGLWPRTARTLSISAVLLQGLWLCLLLVDAKVFTLYRFHLNAMVVNMVFGGALQDQVALSWKTWLQVALLVAAVFAAEGLLAWACWKLLPAAPRRRRVLQAWAAVALLMAGGQVATAYYDARGDREVIAQWNYLPWAQPITAKSFMRRLGVVSQQQAGLPDPRHAQLQYPLHPLRCQNPHRPNVLMVVLESLRQDVLTPQLMPNTSALAQDARVFDQHFSTGNATRYGLFGLLYGLPGGYWPSMLDEQRGSQLFQVLGQQGYDLHLYGSAPLYSPEFDRTAFADVRDQLHQGPSALKSDGRDRAIISALQQDIRASQAAQRPWFGFVFLDSTHAPYHMPDGYPPVATPMAADIDFLKFGPEHDPTPELNRYRTAVHYADSLIGSLLDDLRAQGLAEDTIVLVTGDHAEEFNDLKLNYWGHNGNFSDYQLQVPFVLHWPGRAAGHDARTSSHEDWVPTLMRHALGCENALSDYSTGQDLLAEPQGPRALVVESWSQRAIRHGDAIYVFDKFGNATALDLRYRPLSQQAPDAAAVRTAWEALTHFRNR
ncbi:sulfatase-like hydrolase/transferase [Stenotrophomonas maltophilia group sp. P373]